MGLGKWIGGVMGFMAMGPLGALAGYAIGSLFDKAAEGEEVASGPSGDPAAGGYADGRRNSFLFSLLVMASYVIRADGKIMHSEMEYVRNFLRTNFGEQAVAEGQQILMNLFEERKRMDRSNPMAFRNTIHDCGAQMAVYLSYEERLQLLDFLVMIARSDGSVCQAEIEALREVAVAMGLPAGEVDSMLHLGSDTLDDAYKVLEVDPSATDAEVRAAYRRLALKHHPDKVAALGEDIRKAAEEKFQQINAAKEEMMLVLNGGASKGAASYRDLGVQGQRNEMMCPLHGRHSGGRRQTLLPLGASRAFGCCLPNALKQVLAFGTDLHHVQTDDFGAVERAVGIFDAFQPVFGGVLAQQQREGRHPFRLVQAAVGGAFHHDAFVGGRELFGDDPCASHYAE